MVRQKRRSLTGACVDEIPKRTDYMGDVGIDNRIILKIYVKEI
jgi:hypothetical protein